MHIFVNFPLHFLMNFAKKNLLKKHLLCLQYQSFLLHNRCHIAYEIDPWD